MRVVRQRADWDCAVAALATLTGVAYATIAAVVEQVAPRHHGLYNREVVEVAAGLQLPLSPTRSFDRDRSSGILRVHWPHRSARGKASPGGHFVVLDRGLIHDPHDGTRTPWRDYASRHSARLCTLLRVG
jgi:hypothetical protein